MDMMKMMKEAMAMRSRLAEMDKQLKNTVIDVEHNGVKVTINAKSEIQGINIADDVFKLEKGKAETMILSALQAAVKRSQEVMAAEAKKLTGGAKIPGLV